MRLSPETLRTQLRSGLEELLHRTTPGERLPSEQALAQQGPSVLNGAWNTRSGLMDRATGTPLQLGYSFSGDQGQVTVTRPDGVKCVAQTAATVAGSGVNITTQGNAVCPDGKSYRMPEVKCEPQGDGTVRCTGHYGSYSFPIQFYNAQ